MSGMNEFELPYLYWIPKLHKNPYKHRYIAGSSKCSTNPLSMLLTNILTAVKEKLQTYCATTYARTRCKSDVDSQKFKRTSSKSKSTKLLSNK